MQLVKMRPMHKVSKQARCLGAWLSYVIFCSRSWWWFWLVAEGSSSSATFDDAREWRRCRRYSTKQQRFKRALIALLSSVLLVVTRLRSFSKEETRTLAVVCNSSVLLNIGKSIWKVVAQPTTQCQHKEKLSLQLFCNFERKSKIRSKGEPVNISRGMETLGTPHGYGPPVPLGTRLDQRAQVSLNKKVFKTLCFLGLSVLISSIIYIRIL